MTLMAALGIRKYSPLPTLAVLRHSDMCGFVAMGAGAKIVYACLKYGAV